MSKKLQCNNVTVNLRSYVVSRLAVESYTIRSSLRSRRVASRRVLCVTSHDPSTRPVPRPRVHANELDALDRSTRLDALDRSSRYRSIESVSIESIASTDRPASPRSLPTDTPRARSSPPSRARDDAVVVTCVRVRANEIHRCAHPLDDVRARGLLVPRARSPPGRRVASKSRPTHPSRIVRARKTSSRRRARERENKKRENKTSRIASRRRLASRTVVVVVARVIMRR